MFPKDVSEISWLIVTQRCCGDGQLVQRGGRLPDVKGLVQMVKCLCMEFKCMCMKRNPFEGC